jgi:hypothetical protein
LLRAAASAGGAVAAEMTDEAEEGERP